MLTVLRRKRGDSFDVGRVNGPRGKATLEAITEQSIHLRFAWGEPPDPAPPLHLFIGIPRPQTARKVLVEAASLGVASICFFQSERGEPSYAASTLWSSGEYQRHVISGVEQAFCTQLPEVHLFPSAAAAFAALPSAGARLALDNYEATVPLGEAPLATPLVLALGSERGWSPNERELLRHHQFILAHLGPRVLRTETAVVASHAICASRLGLHLSVTV